MITLEKAKQALVASENKARELGIAVSTYIVDEHGIPLVMSRMEGAFFVSPRIAQVKAFTAANLEMPSGDLGQYACEGKPLMGINTVLGGELTTLPGGLPVVQEEIVVGGVGVGGSADVSQDVACALEAKQVLEA